MQKKLRKSQVSSRREPTIALINIVFLMLIFFLIAGTLVTPLEADLKLVNTSELEGTAPPRCVGLECGGATKLSRRSDNPLRLHDYGE